MDLDTDSNWLTGQYNNRARVPEAPAILARWAEDSAQARATLKSELDIPYGEDPSERLDIFMPSTDDAPAGLDLSRGARSRRRAGRPVLVFIHGGYWRSLDKSDHSFVATDFVRAGALVVVPNYALCPAVHIDDIALQTARAVAWTWLHIRRWGGDPRRLVVAGHSAGGHLAAMMLACHWRSLDPSLPSDLLQRTLALSGLFEMEPLRHTPFLQQDLRLTPESARRLSPALYPAPKTGILHALVGGAESEEFLRQNQLIQQRWGARRVPVCESVPGMHHFSVLDSLARAGEQVHGRARQLLGIGP